ncbi:hypothetical protein PRIPAC_89196, partial [Pristionchus pacificus]|uniref:Uncharacterized protein n=1 Tax=Pristionchus pacificus TaxID=54126 RepID=A0A2A6B3I9_PRIPA
AKFAKKRYGGFRAGRMSFASRVLLLLLLSSMVSTVTSQRLCGRRLTEAPSRPPEASSERLSSRLRPSSGSTRARMARAVSSPSRDARTSTESLPTSDRPPPPPSSKLLRTLLLIVFFDNEVTI